MTKTTNLYLNLCPGWQDNPSFYLCATGQPELNPLPSQWRRVKITVELPIFGGSADVTDEVKSIVTPL